MKILVVGTHKRGMYNAGFNSLTLGMAKTGVAFDHYPNILTHSDDFTYVHLNRSSYDRISYPKYTEIVKNLREKHYDLIITKVCTVNYEGGKLGNISRIVKRLKYSFASKKYKLGGTVVTDWLKAGIELPPIIVIDDMDDQFIWPVDLDLLLNCRLYFKRELPFDTFFSFRLFESKLEKKQKLTLANRVKPIWLSYDWHTMASSANIENVNSYGSRDIDISHMCDIYTNYNRIKILPQLDALRKKYNIVTTENGYLSRGKYFETARRTKIGLSLEGRGWDCIKHYELMLSGALLFITRPPIQLAVNFKDGENCVFIDNDLSNFEELAEYHLQNPELSAEIARNGYELAKDHLGNEKLAEYVMNTIREHIRQHG